MSRINNQRPNFFPEPQRKARTLKGERGKQKSIFESGKIGKKEKQKVRDVSVQVSEKMREFSRMKDLVNSAPLLSKEERMSHLKKSIEKGDYEIDYDSLANIILKEER